MYVGTTKRLHLYRVRPYNSYPGGIQNSAQIVL